QKFKIYTPNENYEATIFSVYSIGVNTESNNIKKLNFDERIDYYKKASKITIKSDKEITKIVKLSTCSYLNAKTSPTDQRYYIIAYLSGNTKIYDTLSTYELLKMCCDIYGVDKENSEKRIKEITKVLGMEQFLYNKIANLSTGQTQKVNLARCLVHNPKYYILDEATTGLDIISSQIILNFIKEERNKGKTILYSTHYMEEAENICNRVI